MVVDRKIAIISSNNIQDNDNLEMMTHLEGSIVDSFYDLSILCWHNAFHPPLPQSQNPAAKGEIPSFQIHLHKTMFDENGVFKNSTAQIFPTTGTEHDRLRNDEANRGPGLGGKDSEETSEGGNLSKVVQIGNQTRLPEHTGDDPHWDPDIAAEVKRAQSVLSSKEGESRMQAVTRHLSKLPSFYGQNYVD